jgi:hypothetical protein
MTVLRVNAIDICSRRRINRRNNPIYNLPSPSSLMFWGIFGILASQMLMQQELFQVDITMTRIIRWIKFNSGNITEDDHLNVSQKKGLDFYFSSIFPAVYASSTSMDASTLRSLEMSNQDIPSLLALVQEEEEEEEEEEEVTGRRHDTKDHLDIVETVQESSLESRQDEYENHYQEDNVYESDVEDYNTYYDVEEESDVDEMYNTDDSSVGRELQQQQDETKLDFDLKESSLSLSQQDQENAMSDSDEWQNSNNKTDNQLFHDIREYGNEEDQDNFFDNSDDESNHDGRVPDAYLENVNMEESLLPDEEYYDDEYEEDSDLQSLHRLDNHDDSGDENHPQEHVITESEKRESFTTELVDNITPRKIPVPSVPSSSIPIMLLPKLGKTLIHSPIAVQIFAAGTLGNIALNRLGWRKRMRMRKSGSDEDQNKSTFLGSTVGDGARNNDNILDDTIYEVHSDFEDSEFVHDDDDDDNEDDNKEEENSGSGFGRTRATRNYSTTKEFENSHRNDTNDVTLLLREDTMEPSSAATQGESTSNKQHISVKNNRKFKLWTRKSSIDDSRNNVYGDSDTDKQEYASPKPAKRKLAFFRGRRALETEISTLHIEVDHLTKRAVEAESARDRFETDCDIAMHEVRVFAFFTCFQYTHTLMFHHLF